MKLHLRQPWMVTHFLFLVALVMFPIGCNRGEPRIHPPDFALGAGKAAIEAYDTDGDGAIGDDEMDRVPALRAAIKQVDTDGNGSVTGEEIDARIQAWLYSRSGQTALNCQVLLDDSPLPDALVELIPEPFLGPNVHPANGTTGPHGEGEISISAEHLANPRYGGVACGWYKIRVTSKDQDIPAKYNSQTTLGCEVAIDAHWVGQDVLKIDMKSDLKSE